MTEQWTEVRCIACRPLNYVDPNFHNLREPRLLMFVYGCITPQDVQIRIRCDRCRSWIMWTYGTSKLEVWSYGKPRVIKPKKVAFE